MVMEEQLRSPAGLSYKCEQTNGGPKGLGGVNTIPEQHSECTVVKEMEGYRQFVC